LAACGDDKYEQTRSADLIFESGSVYTMDPKLPEAEAVAVKEGKIVYVGDDTGLKEWRGKDTQIINLKGKMLLPGFVDTHNHAYLRAENIYWVNLEAPSLDSYKVATQNFLAKQPEVKQVRGVGWNLNYVLAQAKAAGRSPAQLLDEIVGKDIPAVFITHGHHEVWANTRAMQNAVSMQLLQTQWEHLLIAIAKVTQPESSVSLEHKIWLLVHFPNLTLQ